MRSEGEGGQYLVRFGRAAKESVPLAQGGVSLEALGAGRHQWAPASSSSLRRKQQVGAKAPLRGPGLRGSVIVTWQRGTVGTTRGSGSGRGGLRVEGTE